MAAKISGVRLSVMMLKMAANITENAVIIGTLTAIDRKESKMGMGITARIAERRVRSMRATNLIFSVE